MSPTQPTERTQARRKPRAAAKAPARKHQGKRAAGGKRGHPIGIMFAVIGALAIVAMFWFIGMAGYRGEDTWVRIPAGATSGAVRDSLRSRLGSTTGTRTYLLWKMQGGSAATARGAYLITHGESALRTAHKIARGRQTPVTLTFNNVRTMGQLADRIAATIDCTPGDFIAGSDSVLHAAGFAREEYPAVFMPDSYEVYWTSSPATVTEKILAHYRDFWTAGRLEKARRLGLTPAQVATVASIVEEETAMRDERPMVARLYLNRLKKNMRLQADPTVKFAVGDFSLRRILASHLSVPSPYNTYQHTGLPPGPIRMPQAATVDAVLDAPDHSYLFMCAREDFSGYHNFATDYATHTANARRYRQELDRRNIR